MDVPSEYIRTASDRRAVELGYRWSQAAVDHVVRFGASLRDPNDASRPFELLTWQYRDVVAPLFGWRAPDGRRRFARLNVWIPKKNGKSGLLAFLALVYLLADGEKRPGVYNLATAAKQAGDMYGDAAAMLKGTAWTPVVRLVAYRHAIVCPGNGGVFQALASAADSAEGVRGSFVCIDEVHVSLAKHPDLWDSLEFAGEGRRQPLLANISTAGDDRQTVGYQLYDSAKRIIDGTAIDLGTLPVVYEASDQDDYTDAELAAANPAVGQVLELARLRSQWDRVKATGFGAENFKRRRLNVWTKRSSAWLNAAAWDALAADPPGDVSGLTLYAGIDLSSVLDLTACVVVWREPAGRYWFCPHFWLPRQGIEDRCRHEADYLGAEASGHMTLCDGQAVDHAAVGRWLLGWRDRGAAIAQVGFDPWRSAELAKSLEAEGLDCVAVKQGWNLSEPALKLESLIVTGELAHDGNPVQSWCIGNAERRMDNNGKLAIVKPKDKRKRIDGVVAAVIGLYLATFAETGFVCG
jgi:phage terminase large subunit-like protein